MRVFVCVCMYASVFACEYECVFVCMCAHACVPHIPTHVSSESLGPGFISSEHHGSSPSSPKQRERIPLLLGKTGSVDGGGDGGQEGRRGDYRLGCKWCQELVEHLVCGKQGEESLRKERGSGSSVTACLLLGPLWAKQRRGRARGWGKGREEAKFCSPAADKLARRKPRLSDRTLEVHNSLKGFVWKPVILTLSRGWEETRGLMCCAPQTFVSHPTVALCGVTDIHDLGQGSQTLAPFYKGKD